MVFLLPYLQVSFSSGHSTLFSLFFFLVGQSQPFAQWRHWVSILFAFLFAPVLLACSGAEAWRRAEGLIAGEFEGRLLTQTFPLIVSTMTGFLLLPDHEAYKRVS